MTHQSDIYEPCPCASGKKYKFCCYQKDREARKSAKCGLCGGQENLMKTECCGRWICEEDSYQLFSFARNSCARNHRKYTLCGTHYHWGHVGRWHDCAKCRDKLETEVYVWQGTNEYNFEKLHNLPAFDPTHCRQCKKEIILGTEPYSQRGGEYLCERCTSQMIQELMAQRQKRAEDRNSFETHDIERIWAEWLGREWDHVNHYYRLNLSRPVITLARFKRQHGHWDPVSQTISIGIETIKQYPWHVVVDILKHEMAHQYVSEFAQHGESEHGSHFRRACKLMGVPDWAAAATGVLPHEIPDWRTGSLTEEEKRLLDKTNKLLALAQSDNEHEAALAMQRVRELYAKYNLDQVAKRKEAQFVSWILNFKSKRIEGWQSLILVILDKHFFVRTICFSEFDPVDLVTYKAAEMIGRKENVLMAEYVYQFLEQTVHALWEKHRSQKPSLENLPHATFRSEKRHFMLGALDGFREQLDQTNSYQNLRRSETECKTLVKMEDNKLNEFYRRKYPRTHKGSGGGFNPDRETYKSGVSEGQKIRLHKPVTGQAGFRGNVLTS